MLHILTIAVGEIIHACIRDLKLSNIDVQREYLSKKEQIWLLCEVSIRFQNSRFLYTLE